MLNEEGQASVRAAQRDACCGRCPNSRHSLIVLKLWNVLPPKFIGWVGDSHSSRPQDESGGCSCRQTWRLFRVFVRPSLMLGDVLLFLYREVKRASDSDTPSIVGKLAPKSNMPRSLVQLLLPSRRGITRNKCFDCRSTVPWGCVSDGNWCTPEVGE